MNIPIYCCNINVDIHNIEWVKCQPKGGMNESISLDEGRNGVRQIHIHQRAWMGTVYIVR